MVEQQVVSPLAEKKSVWYGMGKAVEKLGPKAWEARVEKVIDEKILPKASPAVKEWIEKNRGWIAKAGGWAATGAEVAIVAGAAYGGYRGIKMLIERRKAKDMEIIPPKPSQPTKPKSAAPQVIDLQFRTDAPPKDNGIRVGSSEWFEREAKHKAAEDDVSPELRKLGESAVANKRKGVPQAKAAASMRGSDGRTVPVDEEGVPEWLLKLGHNAHHPDTSLPPFMARVRGEKPSPSPFPNVGQPMDSKDLPDFLKERFPQGASPRKVENTMLFAPAQLAERVLATSAPAEAKPAAFRIADIGKKVTAILHKPQEAW